jgi:glutamate formiminotransferase
VFTVAGAAAPLLEAVLALFERAVADIDLRTHTGVHPRIGAVDVVPFVPLEASTLPECVALAKAAGAAVAARHGVPVFLSAEAASTPARRHLEDIRRGPFEGLAVRMAGALGPPDFGPSAPHPTAGASAIGARSVLVAYNINLATDRLDVAKSVAAAVRERGGGLPGVKAMGVPTAVPGVVQVSMNLVDCQRTPIPAVFEAVAREGARHGVSIVDTEIVGLVPRAALAGRSPASLLIRDFTERRILEHQVDRVRRSI